MMGRAAFRAVLLGALLASAFCTGAVAKPRPQAPGNYAGEIRRQSGALDSIKNEIDQRRRKIRDLEKAEGSSLSRLEYLEANIRESRRYIELLSIRIDSVVGAIARLDDSLHQAGVQLADRKKFMNSRLRRAYIARNETPLMMLFLSRTPAEAINRKRYIEAIHRYDLRLMEQINQEQQDFNSRKDRCESERRELASLSAAKSSEKEMLEKEEASRLLIVKNIRETKQAYQKKIAQLETAQRKLTDVIKGLTQKMREARRRSPASPVITGTAPFEKRRGQFPWPVDGEVVSRFGKIVHPVYHTVTFNNGIDIGTQPGRPVKCIAPGSVLYTGTMRGMGKFVIVDHGNNYLTVYANLDQIAVSNGQSLAAGSVVGRPGSSEEGGGSQVHFEIRRSTDSLDPLSWLRGAGK